MVITAAAFAVVALLTDPWRLENSNLTPSTAPRTVFSYTNYSGVQTYFGGPNAPTWARYAVTSKLTRTVTIDEDKTDYGTWAEPEWSAPFATLGDWSINPYFTQDNLNQTFVPDSHMYVHKANIKTSAGYERWREQVPHSFHSAWRNRYWQTVESENRDVVPLDPDN